jgi:hypothetical protein
MFMSTVVLLLLFVVLYLMPMREGNKPKVTKLANTTQAGAVNKCTENIKECHLDKYKHCALCKTVEVKTVKANSSTKQVAAAKPTKK